MDTNVIAENHKMGQSNSQVGLHEANTANEGHVVDRNSIPKRIQFYLSEAYMSGEDVALISWIATMQDSIIQVLQAAGVMKSEGATTSANARVADDPIGSRPRSASDVVQSHTSLDRDSVSMPKVSSGATSSLGKGAALHLSHVLVPSRLHSSDGNLASTCHPGIDCIWTVTFIRWQPWNCISSWYTSNLGHAYRRRWRPKQSTAKQSQRHAADDPNHTPTSRGRWISFARGFFFAMHILLCLINKLLDAKRECEAICRPTDRNLQYCLCLSSVLEMPY